MGKAWMRGVGAGLMEVGRQVELSRREKLEQQKQDNLMAIAEGRLGIEKQQMEQQGEQQERIFASKADETYYNRVDARVKEAYGKEPMTAMESLILKATLENDTSGATPLDTIKSLQEQGLIPEGKMPSMAKINRLYRTIETEWKSTVGKGKNAGEFDMAREISRFPLLETGLTEAATAVEAAKGDPSAPETQQAQGWIDTALNEIFGSDVAGATLPADEYLKRSYEGFKTWLIDGVMAGEDQKAVGPMGAQVDANNTKLQGMGNEALAAVNPQRWGESISGAAAALMNPLIAKGTEVAGSLTGDVRRQQAEAKGTPLMMTPDSQYTRGPTQTMPGAEVYDAQRITPHWLKR